MLKFKDFAPFDADEDINSESGFFVNNNQYNNATFAHRADFELIFSLRSSQIYSMFMVQSIVVGHTNNKILCIIFYAKF